MSADHLSMLSPTGDQVTYSFTLVNTGNVKLRGLQMAINHVYNSALLTSLLCVDTNSTEPWLTGGNLTVGQEVRCNTSYTFDQNSVESGDVTAALAYQAANLPPTTTSFDKILVPNTPAATLLVDAAECTPPNKAGQCIYHWWMCSMQTYMLCTCVSPVLPVRSVCTNVRHLSTQWLPARLTLTCSAA